MQEQGTLSVVATPIGNLADITLRALDTLKSADAIACEDTRVTAKLLSRYEIEKPLLIFHAQSGRSATSRILQMLADGKHVALVTDAGTPGISDPGSALVHEVRMRLKDEVRVVAIPGPAAVTAALSIAGVPTDEFVFLGFLPHKKGRKTLFEEIGESKRTMVFYESPHRIEKALASLTEVLQEDRRVIVLREITKMYESLVEGSAQEVQEHFVEHQDQVRGEFVVIVAP
ncbi:MAG TPA: 16S rRNA (cytidine(1402)-2'-O)-methyltransferase [Candidatus Paceibacterota bacterium]|nr:16S rRNA (cytidine(1402)-2'-O)-methyltransferase [Candidatus Paceibacterota bacterium]